MRGARDARGVRSARMRGIELSLPDFCHSFLLLKSGSESGSGSRAKHPAYNGYRMHIVFPM